MAASRTYLRKLCEVIVDMNFLETPSISSEPFVERDGVPFRVLCREGEETEGASEQTFIVVFLNLSAANTPSSSKSMEGFSNRLDPSP
jgi:hypothetical protein